MRRIPGGLRGLLVPSSFARCAAHGRPPSRVRGREIRFSRFGPGGRFWKLKEFARTHGWNSPLDSEQIRAVASPRSPESGRWHLSA